MSAWGWTRERPTEPGWYWVRRLDHRCELLVVQAYELDREPEMHFAIPDQMGPCLADHWILADCEWSGPLVPPA